jgi:peptide/nickel transport system permease protein
MTRWLAFLARRTTAGIFTLIAMTTIAFVVFWATKTQPALFVYPGHSGALSSYQVRHGDHVLGIDKPKIEQWFDYETHLLRFDLGKQWSGARLIDNRLVSGELPIAPTLYPALRTTLSLLLGGAALVLILAIPLGAFAGARIGSISDRTITLIALLGICTHPMVIGILVRVLFAGRLHWFPPVGYCPLHGSHGPDCGGLIDWADHLALPWLTFALLFLALYIRMVRTTVADTLNEDFVRTARAKGASELRVITRHVLPNTTVKLLTMIGMEIGTAIGVCIYIETAYSLSGLAQTAVYYMAGNNNLDLPMILAIVFLISLIVIIGNLAVDALYFFVDPRAAITHNRAPATKAAAGGVF